MIETEVNYLYSIGIKKELKQMSYYSNLREGDRSMIKVLVVDDEIIARRSTILGIDWPSLGCIIVAEASNGVEGIEAVHQFNPDLIITDIKMPKMDGIEMVWVLREEKNDVAVIFLTAYNDFSYAQKAVKLFASDYILKPFENEELKNAVLRIKDNISNKKQKALTIKEIGTKDIKGKKSKYVIETMDYISENYSDHNINVETIAESVGLSSRHLSRIFKKETGHTILTYITLYRIHEGIALLLDCRFRVYEVANKVGYNDVTYFSSIFKKIVGVSPSEYQGITK